MKLTLNKMKNIRFSNTPVQGVFQWSITSSSATLRFDLDHVKLVNNAETCSWVLRSPAMNCPRPSGKDRLATSKETIPGYRKRLKIEYYWIELLSSFKPLLWLTFSLRMCLELCCFSWTSHIVGEPIHRTLHPVQKKPWNDDTYNTFLYVYTVKLFICNMVVSLNLSKIRVNWNCNF